ncbi:MAG: hypothetical protein A2V93_05355 [Ignavibacteria bacterium RBG_16_34_14]|nr:MAG: hypothetical protein A2V93_05355 [Ignavibacteria bacterium RBG_16_34_14]
MKTHILLFKINIYFFSLLLVYLPNIFSQTLTAEQIYKKVTDAVVVILAYDNNDELSKQGSGVVINDKGYIVTNYHVLAGCERIEIVHNKEIVPYDDIIGIDVDKDILILKIEDKKFPSLKIGDSKTVNIGQRVYAIGSPLGFENTISEGIISGLRSYKESGKNFIQITASISSGSSGGAVVNDKGELIGISTLTAKEGQNLNFAIPINIVLGVDISSYSKNEAYKDFELFYKGNAEYKKGNHHAAIIFYTSFIEEYPNNEAAYFNRGVVKSDIEDYRGAIQDYNKAIEINPKYAGAYYNRGIAKGKLEDFREAIQDYNKAIEINPNDEDAYYNRGVLKSYVGDYKGEIQDYNKAIDINPKYADAYFNRGIAKGKLEDYREAIEDYNKVIEINPNDAEAYYNRGNAKANLEDYRGAIQDYNKAIDINPKYAETYNNRGIVKGKLEDYRGAIQDYSKAIKINHKYADAYNNRGVAKGKLEDYKGAIQDYNNAIEINPKYAGAYYNRGIAKYNLGKKSEACLDWRKAGELGVDDAYDLIRKYCN